MSFGDGPPYSEDEDLHSPVVSAPHHRKNKSTGTVLNGRKGGFPDETTDYFSGAGDRGTFVGMNSDGSETYYVNEEEAADDGPGGELVTYPVDEGRYSQIMPASYNGHQAGGAEMGFDSEDDFASVNRYSRDYQFAVGCPDEEMHGKAVALFDFTREHENELALSEGQVIFVSYRHGQGWLVAEDPKTGESGLVPEEFVRLLRDIEGGLTSLNGDPNSGEYTYLSPESIASDQSATPTQTDQLSLNSNDADYSETKDDGKLLSTTDNVIESDITEQRKDTSSSAENHSGNEADGNHVSLATKP
jgi:hypothetical protein